MICRMETIVLKTFWSLVMHSRYTSVLISSVATFPLLSMMHCAESVNCGRIFTTLWSYHDALHGVLFGLIVFYLFLRRFCANICSSLLLCSKLSSILPPWL